jgi:nucleoid-associated protein Lsr2
VAGRTGLTVPDDLAACARLADAIPISGAHRRGCTSCAAWMACLVRQIRQGDGTSVAQKIQTLLIDDLDGTKADGTVRFGLDGTEYETELNAGHARALPEALARYASAARRARRGARRHARGGRRMAGGLNTTEVRERAKAQGIDVKDRGRCLPSWWSSSRPQPRSRVLDIPVAGTTAPHPHADDRMLMRRPYRPPGAGEAGRERHVRCRLLSLRRSAAGSMARDGQLRLPMSSGDAARLVACGDKREGGLT